MVTGRVKSGGDTVLRRRRNGCVVVASQEGLAHTNAGVGFGLTPGSDRLVVKTIVGYRLPF